MQGPAALSHAEFYAILGVCAAIGFMLWRGMKKPSLYRYHEAFFLAMCALGMSVFLLTGVRAVELQAASVAVHHSSNSSDLRQCRCLCDPAAVDGIHKQDLLHNVDIERRDDDFLVDLRLFGRSRQLLSVVFSVPPLGHSHLQGQAASLPLALLDLGVSKANKSDKPADQSAAQRGEKSPQVHTAPHVVFSQGSVSGGAA